MKVADFPIGSRVTVGDDVETVWSVVQHDGSGFVWLHRVEDRPQEDGRIGSTNIVSMVWAGEQQTG